MFTVRGGATRVYWAHLVLALVCMSSASCELLRTPDPEFGVSLELATNRAAAISDLRYDLHFRIPEAATDTVSGTVSIAFALSALDQPLVLDFRGDSGSVREVTVNGNPVTPRITPGHIVIPAKRFTHGDNVVAMAFQSSDEALNRNPDFLYALFVPDRASTAFPSFDQPDLKARYHLTLDIPVAWKAVANGAQVSADTSGNRAILNFSDTEPLSTYLFTFAVGALKAETAIRDGRTYTMYHRETDSAKVARNRDAIFDLHATAIKALEAYTDIPYPFGKVAFFAVPAFQFGGMEHPGAVWYRAGSLFLDESATQNQYLGRASLIAHETAHMWFGDLVTMRWFNDVWMKEVFANFMAAKIVQPSFPEVNHDLRFFLSNHPTAYAVDRTLGANPIRQNLENLRQAGSLYGAIIYQKAPIVMRQLEQLVGDTVFRNGLRSYLKKYQFANASWTDLISILDDLSPENLAAWSHAWVETAWRPALAATWDNGRITVSQKDPLSSRNLLWQQKLSVASGFGSHVVLDTVTLTTARVTTAVVDSVAPQTRPDWILPASDGVSYGRVVLDSTSRIALLTALPAIANPVVRATAINALWESVLSGALSPTVFVDFLERAVVIERDELIVQQMLGLLRGTYWRFLNDSTRLALAPHVESTMWNAFTRAESVSKKAAFWSSYVGVAATDSALARIYRVWAKQETLQGLPLSESQFTGLAEELAVHGVHNADSILDAESERISNPDRRARFAFVRPSLSADTVVRDSVFRSLSDVANRRPESWALDALRNLNNPMRSAHAESYITPGLRLVEEIQQTGDIFFPLGWLNALLDGHQSVAAANTIVQFLDANPTLQPRLRGKVLQAADDVFRAARIVHGWKGGPALEGEVGR